MNTGEKPGTVCFLRERVQHAFTVFPQGYLKSPYLLTAGSEEIWI